jgi:hypothetical protein
MLGRDPRDDRVRAALASLSAIGAAVAGFGVGLLFGAELAALAWPAVAAGIAAHLFGMIGTMRLQSAHGYRPSALERIGYWTCGAIIAALLVYAGVEIAR